jgi:hypothetical protein
MRNQSELQACLNELIHTADEELCANIRKLLAGDETVRKMVESALDQVDSDAAKYQE